MEPPNSPVGSCNLPLTAHPPPLPTHPLVCTIRDITAVVKKVAQKLATIDSYETLAKRLLSCTVNQRGYNLA